MPEVSPLDGVVLVGVDGSESSDAALRWAADFARTTGAALEAVHVWEVPAVYSWSVWPAEAADYKAAAEKLLHESVERALGDHFPVAVTERLEEGHAVYVLSKLSESATLLVVGSRGLGPFKGLLLGSVSANLAMHACCPLLIFRPHRSAGHEEAADG